jgi:hypothetical protein
MINRFGSQNVFLVVALIFFMNCSISYGQQCNNEVNIDYFGNDIQYTIVSSPELCCSLCYANQSCNAWTYVTNIQVCWLKYLGANRVSNPGRKFYLILFVLKKLIHF